MNSAGISMSSMSITGMMLSVDIFPTDIGWSDRRIADYLDHNVDNSDHLSFVPGREQNRFEHYVKTSFLVDATMQEIPQKSNERNINRRPQNTIMSTFLSLRRGVEASRRGALQRFRRFAGADGSPEMGDGMAEAPDEERPPLDEQQELKEVVNDLIITVRSLRKEYLADRLEHEEHLQIFDDNVNEINSILARLNDKRENTPDDRY